MLQYIGDCSTCNTALQVSTYIWKYSVLAFMLMIIVKYTNLQEHSLSIYWCLYIYIKNISMFSLQIFLNTFCRGVVVAPTAILPTTDWRTAVRKQVCVVTSNKTHAVRVVNRMSSGETVSSCISCPSKLSMIQYVSTIVTFLFQNLEELISYAIACKTIIFEFWISLSLSLSKCNWFH